MAQTQTERPQPTPPDEAPCEVQRPIESETAMATRMALTQDQGLCRVPAQGSPAPKEGPHGFE